MIEIKTINKRLRYSVFRSKLAKNDEYFLSISPKSNNFEKNLKEIAEFYSNFLKKTKLSSESQIFCRFFLSDIANQKDILLSSNFFKSLVRGSYSIVGETPLNGSKICMFSYHIDNLENRKEVLEIGRNNWANGIKVKGKNFDLILTSNIIGSDNFDSEKQTKNIFNIYTSKLKALGCSLLNNCVRTWLFVRDIDNHYGGMVKARRKHFEKNGLNKGTRFVASTGIEAKLKEPNLLVSMDAIAISKINPKQIVRMEARSHLNPTHEYGVTFERGTKIEFGDRAHLYVSGTASINNKGEILYPGDVKKQTLRVLENVEALLRPHKASLKDMAYLIVYVRNITDAPLVKNILNKKGLSKLPTFLVEGAVCRPGWLVEIEGIAVIKNSSNWPDFF